MAIHNSRHMGLPQDVNAAIVDAMKALGGTTFVERGVDGYTVVHVTIPM